MPKKPVAEPVIRLYAQLGLRLPAPLYHRFSSWSGVELGQNSDKAKGGGTWPPPISLIEWRARRDLNPRPLD
jgi:hypothetical protein